MESKEVWQLKANFLRYVNEQTNPSSVPLPRKIFKKWPFLSKIFLTSVSVTNKHLVAQI
jgi:hypothetical protein